jgi:hypothetical protein
MIEVIIKSLQNDKISPVDLMGTDIGYVLLELFRQEEDPETLHILV